MRRSRILLAAFVIVLVAAVAGPLVFATVFIPNVLYLLLGVLVGACLFSIVPLFVNRR